MKSFPKLNYWLLMKLQLFHCQWWSLCLALIWSFFHLLSMGKSCTSHYIFVVSRKNFYFPCTVCNIPLFIQSCMILFSNILAHCEYDLNTKAHFLNSASYEGTGRSLSLKLLQQLEEQSQMSAKGPISGMLILHWACSYCFCLLYLWGWTKIPFSPNFDISLVAILPIELWQFEKLEFEQSGLEIRICKRVEVNVFPFLALVLLVKRKLF